MTARATRSARDQRGSTIVEFALVVPLLVTVLLGILQYGYHYWALETGAASAREAARRMAVGTAEACTTAEAVARVGGPAVGSRTPTATVTYVSGRTVGGVVRVTVTFDSLDLHFLPLPDDGRITQTAEARIENVPEADLTC
ncbi:pilus assembly protein [Nocardioides sp. KIGAM211]|uniref:Pilus assembly protein n=1 Tax=Nocardioides luti TaxID=2761101 RepID=A0A7X0RFW2_9ACTN|nr:pilus assembly protein [Nocardioides luti]